MAPVDPEADRLHQVVKETARRRREALRLYRPQAHQEFIHKSTASELLIRGGNRSGKTLCTSAEVASAATGIPLLDSQDKPIPFKYPKDRPLLIWLIGFGDEHCGDTFYRMLFRKNPEFRMIKDKKTGQWRAYRPWDVNDKLRFKESQMAPPMIPHRMIPKTGEGELAFAWKDKRTNCFDKVTLLPRPEFKKHFETVDEDARHGTEICFYSSKREPKMGDPVDLIWIDERIMYSKHYAEWQARISDRAGRILWSLWPGFADDAVMRLLERAKKQERRKRPDVQQIQLRFSDNTYIDDEQKRKRIEGWNEKERESRDYGEVVDWGEKVYPQFSRHYHATPAQHDGLNDAVDKAIQSLNGDVPSDWRRDTILDPGHTHPGVLFVATSPPFDSVGESIAVVYDEIYLPGSDADEIARAVKDKTQGDCIQANWIDNHAGRKTPEGFSTTIAQQYAAAYARAGVRSVQTQNHFMFAPSDVITGLNNVRYYLRQIGKGRLRPRLRVLWERCPNFVFMMTHYAKGVDKKGYITDKPADKQIDPLCDCIRYYCSGNIQYVKPQLVAPEGGVLDYFKNEWQQKKDERVEFSIGQQIAPQSGTNMTEIDSYSYL